MSVIIEFRLPDLQRHRPSAARGPAEIIIFNGVRFERLNAKPPQSRPRAAKRATAAQPLAEAEQA